MTGSKTSGGMANLGGLECSRALFPQERDAGPGDNATAAPVGNRLGTDAKPPGDLNRTGQPCEDFGVRRIFHDAHCNHSYSTAANHGYIEGCNHAHMALNELFKKIREAAKDTPEAAANKAGTSRPAYLKWESGDTANPKLENFLNFCDAYKLDVESLMRGRIVSTAGGKPHLQACETRPEYSPAPPSEWEARDDTERAILDAWRHRTPDQEAMFKALVSMSAKTGESGTEHPPPQSCAS